MSPGARRSHGVGGLVGATILPAMIPVEEALEIVLREDSALPVVDVALDDALSRFLAEDVVSDLDLPPFDRSAMDGYALRAADVAGAPSALEVVGEVRAGQWPDLAVGPGQAVRIMTGAPLPRGADSVQQVEKTQPLDEFRVSDPLPGARRAPTWRPAAPRSGGDVVLARGRGDRHRGDRRARLRRPGPRARRAAARRGAPRHRRRDRGRVGDSGPRADPQQQRARAWPRRRGSPGRRCASSASLPTGRTRSRGRSAPGSTPTCSSSPAASRPATTTSSSRRSSSSGPTFLFTKVAVKPGRAPRLRAPLRRRWSSACPGNPVSAQVTFDLFVRPALLQDAGSARRHAAPRDGGARRRRQEPLRPQEPPARARALRGRTARRAAAPVHGVGRPRRARPGERPRRDRGRPRRRPRPAKPPRPCSSVASWRTTVHHSSVGRPAPGPPGPALSHLDEQGAARMVDVSAKPVTAREAVARGRITIAPAAMRLVRAGQLRKGGVVEVARLAGIMAAKRTADTIPLCHPLPLSHVDVRPPAAPRRVRDRGPRAHRRPHRAPRWRRFTRWRWRPSPSTTW